MMIHASNIWQDELADAVTDADELRHLLDLPELDIPTLEVPLFVPRSFVRRMKKGDPNDPLLLQVLPRKEETELAAGFSCDPVGEVDQVTGDEHSIVLQKYPGRALLLTTDRCGIRCRFCFRRHLLRRRDLNSFCLNELKNTFQPVENDPSLEEVILSGGDPLLLDDEELHGLIHYIAKIPHVKRIRIHSRLPIVLPKRITPRLIETLSSLRPIYLVLHVNHPNEMTEEALSGLKRLSSVVLMSQTVLLKGINDDEATLCRLFECLVDQRIIPYYLHQLDRVQGAAHFEVDPEVGRRLIDRLQDRLPGYAIPRYVREVAGMQSKQKL